MEDCRFSMLCSFRVDYYLLSQCLTLHHSPRESLTVVGPFEVECIQKLYFGKAQTTIQNLGTHGQ